MNQYLTEATKIDLSNIDSQIEENNLKIRSLENANKTLYQDRRNLIYLCNHTDLDGKSTWEYDGQDPGSGKSEHSCTICGKSK